MTRAWRLSRLPVRGSYALVLVALSVGCAARPFSVPVGPGEPVTDIGPAWAEATETCRTTTSYRGSLKLSGDLGTQHIPALTAATVGAAVTSDGRMGLQATSSGQTIFRVAGTAAAATVLLRDDDGDHVLEARAADIVDALVGVKLEPARLLAVLAGCVTISPNALRVERLGDTWRVTTPDATVYVVWVGGRPVVRAGQFDAWTISYGERREGLPMKLRIDATSATAASAVRLALSVASVERNRPVPDAAFVVSTPAAATPMTLAQLRAAGPLGSTR